MNCDTARVYCGAVADGELAVVPPGILDHIRACHDCAVEVEWQREAERATVGALATEVDPRSATRQRWTPVRLLAIAAVVAAVAGTAVYAGLPRNSPTLGPTADGAMGDAAHAYGQAATFTSTDSAAIAGWSAGRGMPVEVMAFPGQVATGARISTIAGHRVMTVIYAGSHGATEVTFVPASMAAGWPAMEATRIAGNPVGLVSRRQGCVVVVTPDDPGLHQAMTTLEA